MMTSKRYFFVFTSNGAILSLMLYVYLAVIKTSLILDVSISTFFMFSMTIMVDLVSCTFVCTVFFISSLVMIYSIGYMKGDNESKFGMIMIMFISFMVMLSLSGNLIWLMVGWDGLGVTSFALVMYFQNWKSFNSAMVTFMCNRAGDLFILSSIAYLMSISVIINWMDNVTMFIQLMVVVTSLSKSAQIPFSSWLPLAMAAPTPVSSLVHSSTLVTAGVFLMIRFNSMMEMSVLNVLMFVSSATVILAGVSALWEFDYKKIVALSTLSHIGLMMMFISIKDEWPAMFHLVTHSMFKSLLFMCAGCTIHSSVNIQDIRMINSVNYNNNMIMIISIMSMMGLPFMSGFYSKEMMMMSIESANNSLFFVTSFLLAIMLTCMYSVRLLVYLMSGKSHLYWDSMKESMFMMQPMIIGCIMSCMVGGMVMWDVMMVEDVLTSPVNNYSMKLLLLMFMFIGINLGFKSMMMNFGSSTLMLSSMMFISSFCYFNQKFMFRSSLNLMNLDIKGWSDYIISSLPKNALDKYKMKLNSLMNQPIFSNNSVIKVVILMMIMNYIVSA